MRAPRKALFLTLILLSIVLQPFLAIVPHAHAAPTLRFEYTDAGPTGVDVYGDSWCGQTFTTVESFNMTSIKARLKKVNSPGTLYARVRATSGGVPTGPDLAIGSIPASSVGTSYAWHEITLGSGCILEAGTKYAFILTDAGNTLNYYRWLYKSPGAFPGGNFVLSINGGSSWSQQTGVDLIFQVWGDEYETVITHESLDSNITYLHDLEPFELNMITKIEPNTTTLVNNTLILDPGGLDISIKYVNGTGFSEHSDPSDYIHLKTGDCSKINHNSTYLTLKYVLYIESDITKREWYDVRSITYASVSDDTYSDVFHLDITTSKAGGVDVVSDSYYNETWVAGKHQVIRNGTFNAMELAPALIPFNLEIGAVEITNTIDQAVYQTIMFNQTYSDPVVVAYIPDRNNDESVDVRVRNITAVGFEIFMQEPDNGAHAQETICYIVMEKGIWLLDDGVKIEADSIDTSSVHISGEAFGGPTVTFSQSFSATPSILHNLNTHANNDFMSSVSHTQTSTSFKIQQEAAASGSGSTTETIGWIAIETGKTGTIKGVKYETGLENDGSNDGVDDTPHTITFAQSFTSAPLIVVKGAYGGGADGYWSRGEGTWTNTLHKVYAEEDQVGDPERVHADEYFAYWAIEAPLMLSIPSYVDSGHFYTTDILDGVDYGAITILFNTTIPSGDSITAEFSQDNSTWYDHDKALGYETIIAGYEAIDLRDLDFNLIYFRFNFTDGGAYSTPRLYQIRVIHEAPVGNGVTYLTGSIGIFLICFIILLPIIFHAVKKR